MTSPFWCTSVDEVNIPEGGNDFFKPADGTTKIRFLAWPVIYYESQAFDENTNKPVWDRKFYHESDTKAINKDSHAKLTFTYMIYDYTDKKVKQWNIATKGLLKAVKSLNGLNPDLSVMDCNVEKKMWSNGFNQYQLASGQATPFTDENVIELFTNDNPFDKVEIAISEKIEETLKAKPSIAEQDAIDAKEIAEIKAEAPIETIPADQAKDLFDKDELPTTEPTGQVKAREKAKDPEETPKTEGSAFWG